MFILDIFCITVFHVFLGHIGEKGGIGMLVRRG